MYIDEITKERIKYITFMKLDHISIISSTTEGIEFYKKLGFEVVSYQDRGYDKLYYLSDGETTLEVYVDNNHPKRVTGPEALGLRHISFVTKDIVSFSNQWNCEIKNDKRGNFCFIYDPDGLPIEIRE